MGIKLKQYTPQLLVFHCPGCLFDHPFRIAPDGTGGDIWTWDGSMEKPTFLPSLLCNKHEPKSRCHSYVRDGMIQFLNDCWHKLKGQTVELPDWEGW